MKLDLHLHSTRSDGAAPPEAIPAAALRAGLDMIAITDHDTTAGVAAAARAAAAGGGPRVIAGIEISCSHNGSDLHLLGYGVEPDHPSLAAVTDLMAELRRVRAGQIVERLNGLGVAITIADVRVPEGCASVGRPHIAEALVRLGAARSVHEAFQRWLGDRQPAAVPARGPDVAAAIAAVRESGGAAVWAHPSLEDASRFGALREMGMEGVETLRPNVSPSVSSALEHSAREEGLFATGGSDWHGGHPALGTWYVTEEHVKGLLERLGIEH